jgi:hypothetical protein
MRPGVERVKRGLWQINSRVSWTSSGQKGLVAYCENAGPPRGCREMRTPGMRKDAETKNASEMRRTLAT